MLSVRLDPVHAGRHRAVLASLPGRFRITSARDADVVVIAGPDWPAAAAAAIAGGARGVLVAAPGPAAAGAVRRLGGAGAVVAVETPVFDATWLAVAERLRAAVPAASFVDALLVTDGDLSAGLVEQLSLIGSVAGPLADISAGDRWVSATAAGTPVDLVRVASAAAPRLTLDIVASDEQWAVCFDRSAPARPTSVARHGEHGTERSPERYESAGRAVWRHLAAALTDGAPLPYTLGDLAAHLEPLG